MNRDLGIKWAVVTAGSAIIAFLIAAFQESSLATKMLFAWFCAFGALSIWVVSINRENSYIEPLTRLWNRRYIEPILQYFGNAAQRTGRTYFLLFVDLDKFKDVNTRFREVGGDQVLQEVARRIRASCKRATDLVVRWGGEEILIIAEGDMEAAAKLAEEIRLAVSSTLITVRGQYIQVTVSIGVALGNKFRFDPKVVRVDAEAAKQTAKEIGRNCFVCAPVATGPLGNTELTDSLEGSGTGNT